MNFGNKYTMRMNDLMKPKSPLAGGPNETSIPISEDGGRPIYAFHGTSQREFSLETRIIWGSLEKKLASQYSEMRQQIDGHGAVIALEFRPKKIFDADQLPSAVTIQSFAAAIKEQSGFYDGDLVEIMANGRYEEESGPHYTAQSFWYHPADSFGQKGRDALMAIYKNAGFDAIKFTENGEESIGALDPRIVKVMA